jgi:hypothetical protein
VIYVIIIELAKALAKWDRLSILGKQMLLVSKKVVQP